MNNKIIGIIFVVFILGISGCKQENICDDLSEKFDVVDSSFSYDNYCRNQNGERDTILVGATLIDVSTFYYDVDAQPWSDSYYHTLKFKGIDEELITFIISDQEVLPYEVGEFYKFDYGRICSHIGSGVNSGRFNDLDLNALEKLDCFF